MTVYTLRWTTILVAILTSALSNYAVAENSKHQVRINYNAAFEPASETAAAQIEVIQRSKAIKSLDFNAPKDRYTDFKGPGKVVRRGDRVIWTVPAKGGTLNFTHRVSNERKGGAFDARMTNNWALLRLDKLFPAATVRARKKAIVEHTFQLAGPESWSFETAYGPAKNLAINIPGDGRYNRPKGWLVAGEIGIRRETISDRAISVAAPKDNGLRRLDVLAFLNWNLPALTQTFKSFPQQLLIVGAGPSFWRGGLSGPNSLYIHADRPLISENGTSTLLHELVHVATRMKAKKKSDWIVEGIAEYYSLEIMRRTGTITEERFREAIANQKRWGKQAKKLSTNRSSGATTAKAVGLIYDLAQELEPQGLDAVVAKLSNRTTSISFRDLKRAVKKTGKVKSKALVSMSENL